MRRFSISKAMLVVALVAGDFAAIRALDPLAAGGDLAIVLVGILPLANIQVVGFWWIARRYRMSLRRRMAGNSSGIIAFLAFTGLSLGILLAVCCIGAEGISKWLAMALNPVGTWLISLGYWSRGIDSPSFRLIVVPCLAGAILSGPPLLLGLAFGWLAGRYELVISRRSP
jgi:hypothetical protein